MKKKINICGAKIKQQRKKLSLDQTALAAAMTTEHGVKLDQSDISEIERNVRSIKDYELCAIATILKVTPHWLLGWK